LPAFVGSGRLSLLRITSGSGSGSTYLASVFGSSSSAASPLATAIFLIESRAAIVPLHSRNLRLVREERDRLMQKKKSAEAGSLQHSRLNTFLLRKNSA
jgi:hypothetical protein